MGCGEGRIALMDFEQEQQIQMIEQAALSFTLMDILMIGAGFASFVGWLVRLEVRSKANAERIAESKETIKLIFKKIDKLGGGNERDRRERDRD